MKTSLNFLLLATLCLAGALSCSGRFGVESAGHSENAERKEIALPSSQYVVSKVAGRYSGLQRYRTSGVNEQRSTFDGVEKRMEDIRFNLTYARGSDSTIEWKVGQETRTLSINSETNEIRDSKGESKEFENAREALWAASAGGDARSLFLIDVFVFRDELKMGNKFFAELVDPKVESESELEGRACYVLTGPVHRIEGRVSYWIDKELWLIRRIERVIVVRKSTPEKEYMSTTVTTETYSDIDAG